MILKPMEIEKRSFEIIQEELKSLGKEIPEELLPIVTRVIHTTADFDYADNLVFSEGAVEKAIAALKEGCPIVTDTQMAMAGINKKTLSLLGSEVHCFMSDEDVAKEAKERETTRAQVAMEKSARLGEPCIYAIGNAPTALISLKSLIEKGKIHPVLIIGVPVGFVNVVESKEMIMEMGVPYIVAKGRKGGSNVAACICNALMYEIGRIFG